MNLKKVIKAIVPSTMRVKLRKYKRHLLNWFKRGNAATTLDQLRDTLTHELGITRGDKIIVSSSFGQLHADYSPQQVVDLLKELVGPDGLIMMPYYPPMNSTEWAAKGLVFDMNNTKSGMGVLTNVFAHSDGAVMSKHPIKAVCAWGAGAEQIVADHDKATTPFYWDSPYGRLLKMHSKSLGLGLKNIAIIHTIEDVLSEHYYDYYQADKFNLGLINLDGGNETVSTYVHDDILFNRCVAPGDYVYELQCASYKRVDFGYAFIYVIDNDDLFERCKIEFANGHTRIKQ